MREREDSEVERIAEQQPLLTLPLRQAGVKRRARTAKNGLSLRSRQSVYLAYHKKKITLADRA